ncbi:outer membrane beta-barrel protein [Pontibacter silvestris]|uniref:Outer membrane beta-barrel protein n=1 Tax=Pontibacter silvestris TaxID=2305183 RepID=A0ABW4WZ11_9BACT|nr:outer membrane beta-barrel protein [Pontibacter silvestris]MCC9135399.1 PorT family protein [Pontibacter silvestris]
MKRILLLLSAIIMAAVTGVSAKGGPTLGQRFGDNKDTIVVKMANGAKMTLYLQNKEQLKAFQNYSLDSLMRVLNKYVQQVDNMEDTTVTSDSKEMTVIFSPSGESGNDTSEKVTVTVQGTNNQEGDVRTEHHEIRLNKTFKIDVEVEENGNDTKVNVNVPTRAERDSIRIANKEKNYKATHTGFDMDLGLNTFVNTDDNLVPDLKPLGSRYVSLNWRLNSQVGGRKSPFHVVSGLEFSFNNYMFERNYIVEEIDGVSQFTRVEDVDFEKSKLTHSAVNIPLMAVLQFKRENGKDGFQIGGGGFAGYRLGTHTKQKYRQDGKTEKDKTRDSFNLNDFQYGLEGVVGYGSLTLFAKYNMNDLFKDGRGPEANVASFGFRLFW